MMIMWKRATIAASIARFYVFTSFACIIVNGFLRHPVGIRTISKLGANPINADGNKFGRDISEEEAFLWFDEALMYVRAGSGGSGSSAVKFGKGRQHMGPMGGSGGNGGSVILEADSNSNTLLRFKGKSSFKANNGKDGSQNFANGEFGEDCIIKVPAGTSVYDNSSQVLIGAVNMPGDRLVIAKGGLGGQGNAALGVTKGEKGTCTPPEGGERRWVQLQLNLVADVGLVGVPNAGKSTLLNAITNARPKIASYPFTTIVPNLGVCEVNSDSKQGFKGNTLVVADIPGLLEGAHRGVGLGRGFLRHVERCRMIIHIVNGDSIDPIGDFIAINRELQLFSPKLAAKPQVVVLNKIDIPHVSERMDELLQSLREIMPHKRLLAMSAAARIGVDTLISKTWSFYQKVKADEQKHSAAETIQLPDVLPISDKYAIVGSMSSPLLQSRGNYDIDESFGSSIGQQNFKVVALADDLVSVDGELIDTLIREYMSSGSYYGSADRLEAMLDALDLSGEVYNCLGGRCEPATDIITVQCNVDGETCTLLLQDGVLSVN